MHRHNQFVVPRIAQSVIRRVCPSVWAGCLVVMVAPSSLLAAVSATITAPSIRLPYSASSQAGTFEVYVQASGSPQPAVSAMQVELQLPSFSTIVFSPSSNTTPTVHPYIFPSQTPPASVTNSGRTIEGLDFEQGNTYPTLSDGAGLLLVSYSVPAGASGYYPLTFVDYSAQNQFGTALFDTNLAQIPTSDQNGSIAILPPTAYWRGAVDANWTTDNLQTGVTNWTIDSAGTTDTHIAPGASTDVFFVGAGAQNLNTTLGANFSIKGLTFTSTATASVGIAGTNTLTIGADGVTVQSGSAAHTINSPVALGGSQTWQVSNATSAPLTIGGGLTVPVGANLAKSGAGELVIAGPPTLGNGSSLAVNGGTLKFNLTSSSANIGTGVTANVAAGATLELAGSMSGLSSTSSPAARVNVANNSTVPGGGLLVTGTNQQVGAITGSGSLNLATGGSLTANSVIQSAIVIGGSPGNMARLTIDASDSSGTSLSGASATDSFTDGFGQSNSTLALPALADPNIGSTGAASAFGPKNSVPEPSSWGLALVAIGVCWLTWVTREKRSRGV